MDNSKLEEMLIELDTRPYKRFMSAKTAAAKFFFGLPITDKKFGLVKNLNLVEEAAIPGDTRLEHQRLLNFPELDEYISNMLGDFFVKNKIVSYETSLVALMSANTSNFQPLHLHRHALAKPIDSLEFSLFISPNSIVNFSYYDYPISQREAIKLKLIDYTDNSRLEHFLKNKKLVTLELHNNEFVKFNGQQIAHQASIESGIGLFIVFARCITESYTSATEKGTL